MKRIIILIFLTSQSFITFGYELSSKISFDKSLTYYKINDGLKEIAQIYLLDPDNTFHFFSIEDNPELFADIDKEIISVSKLKNIRLSYALLADFSKPIKFEKKFNFGYAWNSLGLLLFAPSYLKKVSILNPNNTAKRFFMEIEINGKEFYSLIVFDKIMDIKNVKKIIIGTKNLNQKKFKLYALLDFPIAVMLFNDNKSDTVYVSHKNIEKYSCLYLTGD